MKRDKQKSTTALLFFLGLVFTFGVAVYYPAALFMNNVLQLVPFTILLTGALFFLWIAALYVLFYLLSQKGYISVLFALAVHWLVFSYSDIQQFCEPMISGKIFPYLFMIGIAALMVLSFFARRLSYRLDFVTRRKLILLLNLCVYALIATTVLTHLPPAEAVSPDRPVMKAVQPVNDAVSEEERPNVYLFLLDEYASFDMIQEQYGYDNSAFLAFLRERDFYVSLTSGNEIAYTDILASNMLSIDYAAFTDSFGYDLGHTRTAMDERESLYHSRTAYRNNSYLFDLMRSNHYDTYALDNTNQLYHWGTINADHLVDIPAEANEKGASFLALSQNDIDYWLLVWGKSAFYQREGAVNQTYETASFFYRNSQDLAWKNTLRHAQIISGSFEYLASFQPSESQPAFLYAHLMCPHLPFVFYPNGETKTMELTFAGWAGENAYLDNYQYATNQMTRIIEHLLSADPGCIILLQSDHGARADLAAKGPFVPEYLPILNAVYYQGKEYPKIEGFSGVNTVRAVLSDALQIDLPYVEPPVYVPDGAK